MKQRRLAQHRTAARKRVAERLEDLSVARQRVAERLEDLSIAKLVPSMLTLLGLCSGATAIRFAFGQDWKRAVAAIMAAMLFDMLDGRAARRLGADTRFGAQLDSLADLVSFGVAPAIIVYLWSLARIGDAGWAAALIFCTCSAIRLARFNIQSVRDEGASEANPYFTGLPTPAAACLVVLPMLLSFQFPDGLFRDALFSGALLLIASGLMVSRLPTPSIKYMHLPRQYRVAAMAALVLFVALLVLWPWSTLTTGLLLYLASIPIVIIANELHDEAPRPHS
jgi:CDP-diacylglycerol--serine O-phosphatidyltransferase